MLRMELIIAILYHEIESAREVKKNLQFVQNIMTAWREAEQDLQHPGIETGRVALGTLIVVVPHWSFGISNPW